MKKNVFTTTYNGQTIKAQMSYYYKTGGTSITKPFIVVEGFDPWILQELLQEEIPIEHVHIGFPRHSGFYKSNWQGATLNDEYDLFYIDWDNTLIDIRANAQLLTQIIEEINTLKANSGCTEPNIIMGQSMGGLIARHALRTMETEAKVHETSTFISHDSPHTGANVPLGALYFIQQILSLAHGNSNIVSIADLFTGGFLNKAEETLYCLLNSDSVKQMLVHYVGDYGLPNNSVHQDWQQHLSYIGFPRLTENIAIVNGRQFDRNTTLPTGSHLLYIDGYAKSSLLTDFISPLVGFYLWPLTYIGIFDKLTEAIIFLGSTKINVHAEVNPLSATNGGLILSQLEINYIKRLLWLFPKKYTVFSSTVNVPKTGLYYDDYPGSQYSLNKDIIDTTYNNRKMQRIPFAIIYKP